MNGLTWTSENLVDIGKIFLQKIIKNMRADEGAAVQLGETGTGVQPNYQIILSSGTINPYRGSTHKPFEPREAFNKNNLSRPFTRLEVQTAVGLAVSQGKM